MDLFKPNEPVEATLSRFRFAVRAGSFEVESGVLDLLWNKTKLLQKGHMSSDLLFIDKTSLKHRIRYRGVSSLSLE